MFLELCHEARPLRGVVELPVGMGLEDGVHDLLGGDRREVVKALEIYTRGPDPDAPSVVVGGSDGALTVRIPSWETWNSIDSSADRMRKHRANKTADHPCDASRDATGGDTVTLLDQRRLEKRRAEEIPLPASQGPSPSEPGTREPSSRPIADAPATGANGFALTAIEPPAEKPPKTRKRR